MARIQIISPGGQDERVLLAHNTLGRHPSNTLQVLDRIVSKEHCHIDLVDGHYVLKDLGSLNGTFVNGERVDQCPLKDGDEIHLGGTRLIFTDEAPTASSAGPKPDGEASAALSRGHSTVTISPQGVESQIRTKIAPLLDKGFLPEKLVSSESDLRRDYERLRASYEVIQAIGVELDADKILAKILDCAFHLLEADRGVILLYDEAKELQVRCVRTKSGKEDEALLLSTTIINEVLRDKAAVLSSDASVDSRFQGAHSVIMQGIRSTMAVPLLHAREVFGIMVLDSQIATGAFTDKDLQLFQNIANQAAIALQNSLYAKKLEEAAVTRQRFQRLLSPAIAEQVIEGKVEVAKGGELRETTVLFTDIRGFTAMSETQKPASIVDMLNEYFERMVEIIFRHEGTLDKFIGDEIMALFGAPVAHPDDPDRAVETALEMLEALAEFNRERETQGRDPVHVGIGINTGEVVAGYLGSSRALEYTVIGDTVNTGARLCSLARAGEVIISESTYARVKSRFEMQSRPPAQVKGKAQALRTYRVLGHR
ncbi:MAG: adenylate/guanylate cyclase domain-containing protein [Polyangiales bacterium]